MTKTLKLLDFSNYGEKQFLGKDIYPKSLPCFIIIFNEDNTKEIWQTNEDARYRIQSKIAMRRPDYADYDNKVFIWNDLQEINLSHIKLKTEVKCPPTQHQ